MTNVINFPPTDRLDFEGYNLPSHTKETLERYILDRLPPGGFLTAVLANDLFTAVGRADHWNNQAFKEICGWIINRAPQDCYGSYAIVNKYLETPRVK